MNTRHHSRIMAAFLVLLTLLAVPAAAQNNLSLQVTLPNADTASVELGLEDLDALAQVEFTTTTIWTDGETVFSGVPLKALLEHLEATGEILEMIALNDYAVSMPVSELTDEAPIIATRINGQVMSVRDKGPYWVVYPYDRDLMYRSETTFSRSIWQLNRLKLID